MGEITYTEDNQKKIERLILFIYTVYSFSMMFVYAKEERGGWIDFMLLFCLAVCWAIYLGKCRDYTFRVFVSSIMIQLSIVIYGINMKEFAYVLPLFVTFSILIGVYGKEQVIYISIISTVILFVWHIIFNENVTVDSTREILKVFSQFSNIVLLEYIVYSWTKRNRENSQKLLEMIDELQEMEQKKDDFVANVSHEIRTPINTICGISEIIAREELPKNIQEDIRSIQLAGRNLMSLVSDILDFSELQSGEIELEEEAYHITSTINDIINMTMARKEGKDIEVIVDCDPNIPYVLLGDEKKIRRILMNLVDNAIKFTEEGCVGISIGFRKESYGINLWIGVKDTGIGMDAKSLDNIFASFNQVDTSRKRQEGGLGLGLAISHALVKRMGGALTIKSKPQKGSFIQFVVPQKVVDAAPIVSMAGTEDKKIAIYIDMEQFKMIAIRDEYTNMIMHMKEQFKGEFQICRHFAELQRRVPKEHYSHVFISIAEYKGNQEYFDELAEKTNVITILDYLEEKYITNEKIKKIFKPFYMISLASVLNGEYEKKQETLAGKIKKFTTKNSHVLVVDDNRMNLRVIEGLLLNYNIKVTVAQSGKEALDKINLEDYDFVFMDHMMPEMDGVEVLHRIRNKVGNYYQTVPIVALTANAVAGTRERFLEEGFNDFLEKPIETSVLERVLKRNLPEEKILYKSIYPETDMEKEKPESEEKEKNTNPAYAMEEKIALLKKIGLDVSAGILYCNGKEQYMKVLQGYCEDGDDAGQQAEELFAKQDWKNYTIVVHGMKGSMKSIGAIELSEIALGLELAGKENRIQYILEHHQNLVEEYQKLVRLLCQCEWLCPKKKTGEELGQTEAKDLPVLEDSEFEQILEEMEEAMYSLEGEQILELIGRLEQYQYADTPLKEHLTQIKRKAEMSDYVSAVEMLIRIKQKLAHKEK